MRLIAGKFGGRIISAPNIKSVHPMSEKARGAIFSALGDIEGLSVVDAFSGSGSIGIEAYSRGAKYVVLVEKNKSAAKIINQTISSMDIAEDVKVYNASVEKWTSFNKDKFDIVIADPPYDNFNLQTLDKLIASSLKQDGIFILSWPGRIALPEFTSVVLIKSLSYGDASIGFYKSTL